MREIARRTGGSGPVLEIVIACAALGGAALSALAVMARRSDKETTEGAPATGTSASTEDQEQSPAHEEHRTRD